MDRLRRLLTGLVSCFALSSCAHEGALVLEVSTDLPLPAAGTKLEISIAQGGNALYLQTFDMNRAPAEGGLSLPATLVLIGPDGSPPRQGSIGPGLLTIVGEGPLQIELSVSKDDALVLQRSAVVALPGSWVKLLPLELESACVNVACGEGMTCRAAKCVSSAVAVESLPEG